MLPGPLAAAVLGAPPSRRLQAFYRAWCVAEAAALGLGLDDAGRAVDRTRPGLRPRARP